MYHIFFSHSSVSGHLGCFYVLAIVNSAAMNIEVHVTFWIKSFVWIYSLAPSTMWGHSKKTPAMNQKKGPHQDATMLVPWSWTSSHRDCEKYIYVLFCYSCSNRLRHQTHLKQAQVSRNSVPNRKANCITWNQVSCKCMFQFSFTHTVTWNRNNHGWRKQARPLILRNSWGFPGGAVVENLPANAGDTGSSPGLGGSHMPRSDWACEPQLLSLRVWSLCSAAREAAIVRGPHTAMKSGPPCRNWRKPSHGNEDPTQPKKIIIIN